MKDFPIEELLPRAKYSVYKLVSMAAARALELSEGRRCLAENSSSEKFTTMAFEEIAQGKVGLKGAEGLQVAEEKHQEQEEKEDA